MTASGVTASTVTADDNPFLRVSSLDYRLPPFDEITDDHYVPAFERGMADQRAEVEAIAGAEGPPSFANTIEALERSGDLLHRVAAVFFNLASSVSSERLRALQAEMAPRLSAHSDAIALDPRLFARIAAVHAERDGLEPEQRRLVERLHTDAVRAGAGLRPADQERLRALNDELSTLTTSFSTALLEETNELAVLVEDVGQLAGLAEGMVAAAAEAARERGHRGGYLLTLVLPTGQPVLASLRDRSLRERVFRASMSRGARGGEHDTRALVSRITALRAERAGLLGYQNHAEYVVADQTAGTVQAVSTLLSSLVPAAVANAEAEAGELARLMADDGVPGPLQPWDWAYYAERLRRDGYDLDAAALRPYFELDRVVNGGVFAAAEQLYGVRFAERTDLPTYHPDVRVWEVFDRDGERLGLFLGDYLARESKRGGAWMSSFVDQSRLLDRRPVIVNNLNVIRGSDGGPTLLTVEEVRTAFHEFGHALHGLLSDVGYPRLSGTSVPRDFVEYPSQVNEMWAWDPQVLAGYARHHRTGEPLDPDVGRRLLASQAHGQGFATTEILAAMLLDQAWHRLEPGAVVAPEDVEQFEADALARHGLALPSVPPRYRSTYFAHVFAGGYSAGYYSYLWSEVLDADTVDWFAERGGLRRDSGEIFRRELLSRGGAVDPMQAVRAVLGREPRIEPLLRRRGLASAQPGPANSPEAS